MSSEGIILAASISSSVQTMSRWPSRIAFTSTGSADMGLRPLSESVPISKITPSYSSCVVSSDTLAFIPATSSGSNISTTAPFSSCTYPSLNSTVLSLYSARTAALKLTSSAVYTCCMNFKKLSSPLSEQPQRMTRLIISGKMIFRIPLPSYGLLYYSRPAFISQIFCLTFFEM